MNEILKNYRAAARDYDWATTITAVNALAKSESRVTRAVALAGVVNTTLTAWRTLKSINLTTGRYQIKIHPQDRAYDAILTWVGQMCATPGQREYTLQTRMDRGEFTMAVLPDHAVDQRFVFNGHEVLVSHVKPGQTAKKQSNDPLAELEPDGGYAISFMPKLLQLSVATPEARDELLDELHLIAERAMTGPRRVRMSSQWGWSRDRALPPRSRESVILRDNIGDAIIDDLQRFMSMEEQYLEWGIPWHRGYLLYGPPGTGKTSLAGVLAAHFNLNVYFLMLSGCKSDSQLVELVSGIDPHSILVIEDIDVLDAARSRDDADNEGVTTAGLLNALDGMITPHGMILLMTTNRAETLDHALIRTGRIDRKFEIKAADTDQIQRLVKYFVGVDVDLPETDGEIVPSDVVEIIKERYDAPDTIEAALVEKIEATKKRALYADL